LGGEECWQLFLPKNAWRKKLRSSERKGGGGFSHTRKKDVWPTEIGGRKQGGPVGQKFSHVKGRERGLTLEIGVIHGCEGTFGGKGNIKRIT